MTIVYFDYKFLFVDIGCQGRISDGGVLKKTTFFEAIERDQLKLTSPRPLPGNDDWNWEQDQHPMPFVITADDAFPLTEYFMKPYPQKGITDRKRIFNYRLSRFRRVSENAFGIWVSRFRLFLSRCSLTPENTI